ncbi:MULTISPECIES: hypothetical protein [unclassified Mucilaginibacter]|uniref:hypothetical protein n=1 Tax=unclassified Mucilaginibacter TaxID=2617802 RepID=UPI0008712D0F|nr:MULTISPECIES: hypothetical protein [unclassified Mucilaginibacter]WDZ98532.1 hypothetical protein MusilaSJ_13675 [Mucilaginibacter sp. SJ]SCW87271.1 hypothetical protein SAMN03159284_05226 [Mucilaginibacter sp. NFR10]
MKNLFAQKNNTGLWITAGITGVLAAGAGIWFYFRGKKSDETAGSQQEHVQDYLEAKHPKKKKHKTDVDELADLVHHQAT